MNHAEAARALGCSEATVSWRVFAARGKLKRWLKPATRGSPGSESGALLRLINEVAVRFFVL